MRIFLTGATGYIGSSVLETLHRARRDVTVQTALDGAAQKQKIDRQAVDTFLAAATNRAASGLPAAVVYTSGIWVLGDTAAPVAEDAPVKPTALVAWRPE